MDYLPSVGAGTFGKHALFAECQGWGTRQTRSCLLSTKAVRHSDKHAMTVSAPSHYFFCRALVSALGNVFAECPIKKTRQINFCHHCVRRVLFVECNTRQNFYRVFFGLRRVPLTHGKDPVPVVSMWYYSCTPLFVTCTCLLFDKQNYFLPPSVR